MIPMIILAIAIIPLPTTLTIWWNGIKLTEGVTPIFALYSLLMIYFNIVLLPYLFFGIVYLIYAIAKRATKKRKRVVVPVPYPPF